MNTVGNILKSTRNLKKISIEFVSEELKISTYVLKELENDTHVLYNDLVFYIGHLRSYSNFLELNSEKIIQQYKDQIAFTKEDVSKTIAKPDFQNQSYNFFKFVPISLILIIFISFYVLFINQDLNKSEYALIPDLPESYLPIIEKANLNNSSDSTNSNKSDLRIINDIENVTSANASNKVDNVIKNNIITLKILNPTWLQLRDESNNIIISQLMDKDQEYSYEMQLEYNITAGNGGNIMVIIDDKVRGKIGKFGEVVDSIILDNNFKN
tara:strand:- start:295 stop:1101 length:807 start_codon:yes stop_codon:yes gene_type:complete